MFNNSKKRKDIIIGCSNMGAYIASRLSEMGDDVNIIDRHASSFRILDEAYSGFKTEGDAMDSDFLKQNDIEHADLVLIATEDDNTNSCLAQYIKCILNVPIVVTRIYEIEKTLVLEGTGVKIIYPSILVSNEFFKILNESAEEEEKY